MVSKQNRRREVQVSRIFRAATTLLVFSSTLLAGLQEPSTFDATVPPGRNFDKAEFRLWLPKEAPLIRAVVVLTPGSNGDGRSQVDDAAWQEFASRHSLALLGVRLTDKPHDQSFIEEYVNVSQGSGQALLDALNALAQRSRHAEIAEAPLLLWGMSAGGQFNYEFVAWKPERVIAFVVNKGGIYYSALLPQAARKVPGILFTGGKDLEFRTNTIKGLFAVNRRAGALWALAEEPGAAHIVGRSRDVALIFFEDVLPLRLATSGDNAAGKLISIPEDSGFLGNFETKIATKQTGSAPNYPTAWLPTARVARAWESLISDRPIVP
jgi:dienelactone hydrolase